MQPAARPTSAASPILLEARVTSSTEGRAAEGQHPPRQQWIDVTFPAAPVALHYISFVNYYCAAITISHTANRADDDPLQSMHTRGMDPSWSVVVRKLALMTDPHVEDDAQRYHELTTAHFDKDFDYQRVTRLRIACLQPSPLWREHSLRQLRFYTVEQLAIPPLQPPPTLSPPEHELASTVLGQIAGLGQVASDIRRTIAGASTSTRNVSGSRHRRRTEPHAHTFAPYVVGEWSDELQLSRLDTSTSLASSVAAGMAAASATRAPTAARSSKTGTYRP